MNFAEYTNPLGGGLLIGVAVTLMLLFNGRVTGISGIIAQSFTRPRSENIWRWMFLAGMVVAGAIIFRIRPELFANETNRSLPVIAMAGLLVGFGTVMGSGCTSGHGICGISRLSIRSIVATLVFMMFGFFSVLIVEKLLGGSL